MRKKSHGHYSEHTSSNATAVSCPRPYSITVTEAIPFFHYQQLMKVKTEAMHNIYKEHYDSFVLAKPGEKVFIFLFLQYFQQHYIHVDVYVQITNHDAQKALWSCNPDVHDELEVLADQLLSAKRTHYKQLHKTRHLLRSSQCSVQMRDILMVGKTSFQNLKTKNEMKVKQTKSSVRANYSIGKDK